MINGKIMLVEVPETAYDYQFEHWMIPGTETPEGVWSISFHFNKGINTFEDAARRRIKTAINIYDDPRLLGQLQSGIFKGDRMLSDAQRAMLKAATIDPDKKYVVLSIKNHERNKI